MATIKSFKTVLEYDEGTIEFTCNYQDYLKNNLKFSVDIETKEFEITDNIRIAAKEIFKAIQQSDMYFIKQNENIEIKE
jgi:hypothetical protein